MPTFFPFPTDVGEPAKSLVQGWFEDVQDYASDAWNETQTFIDQLENAFDFDLGLTSLEFDFDQISVNDYSPEKPAEPSVTVELPELPNQPVFEEITVEPVDVPALDIMAPVLVMPETPSPEWPAQVGDPPEVSDPDIPTAPSLSFPTEPNLREITLPDKPNLSLPSFTEDLPAFGLSNPTNTFSFNEDRFDWVDDLRSLVYGTVQTIINAGGDTPTGVEDAIWNRARSRLVDIHDEKMLEVEREFTEKNWNFPNGAIVAARGRALDANSREYSELNYKIIEEMARLSWEQYQKAIEEGIKLEQVLVAYANEINNRELEKRKMLQQFTIDIFNAQVAYLQAKLARYEAAARVYEVQTRAATLTLEAYKVEVEGAKVAAEFQEVLVKVYEIQVDAVKRYVELYNIEMETARLDIAIEEQKVRNYTAQVAAYDAKVRAEAGKFQWYQTTVDAERVKVEAYRAQTEGFRAGVEAKDVEAKINIAEAEEKIRSNANLIEQYKADLENYRVRTNALIENARREAELYGYEVTMYQADLAHANMQIDADIKSYEAMRSHEVNIANINLKQAEQNIQAVLEANRMQVQTIQAGANVNAQLAASALSAVNATATVGYGDDRNFNYSRSNIVSEDFRHNFNES